MDDLEAGNAAFSFAGQSSSGITVTIGAAVEYIPAYLFCSTLNTSNAPNIVKVNFADNGICVYIGDYAFGYCGALASITIPSSVIVIGEFAFISCSSLESITVPDNVASIGIGAFAGCTNLESITLPFVGGSAATKASDATLFGYIFGTNTYTGGALTQQKYSDDADDYVYYFIPESLTTVTITGGNILYGAFYNCTNIESVTLPEDLTSIGEYAFYNCALLEDITIPDSVTLIDSYAFSGCTSFINMVVPESVTSIGEGAFTDCSNLESITLPFVGSGVKTANNTYQYPFGYIFGTTRYSGGTATTQPYYGDSLYVSTSSTYYIPASLTTVTITGGNILYGAFYNCANIESVTLPDSLTAIGDSAFYGCTSLEDITIPDSVEDIGVYAFYGCETLTEITIPEKVTDINNYSFYGCTALTSVTLPENLDSIGDYAFYGCTALKEIDIPDSVMFVGEYAFYGCSALTEITIPEKVTAIENYTFYGCSLFTSVTLPENLTSIGDYSFYGCNSLEEITIPATVKFIGEKAFYNCWSFTCITIPESVTSIGEAAFGGCPKLESITLPFVGGSASATTASESTLFGYIFGTTSYVDAASKTQYYADGSSIIYYIPTKLITVTITGGNILYGAFYNCSMIKCITLPETLTSIGDYSFYGCTSLEGITIPESVKSIGEYAFYGCTALESIVVPESVTMIGEGAFGGCSSLESITLPFVGGSVSATTATGSTLFGYIFGTISYSGGAQTTQYYASGSYRTYNIPTTLTTVTITGGNILYGAFYNCGNIENVTLPENLVTIGAYAFYNCSSLKDITIPDSVEDIGVYAFYGCETLTEITIPEKVTAIENYTFYGCTSLTSVALPENLDSIGEYAFYGCTILESVTLPENLDSIGAYAFYGCTALESIVVPDSVTSIGAAAFGDCSSLVSITLPFVGGSAKSSTDTYQYPLGYIFGTSTSISGNTSTTQRYYGTSTSSTTSSSYYIPATLTSVTITGGNILRGAFYNCANLKSITIGEGVQYIATYAFYGCTGLTEINYNAKDVTDLTSNNYAFYNAGQNGSGITVNIGASVTKIPAYIFCPNNANYTPYITSVVFAENCVCESIGDYAFYYCSSLTSITIPDSVTSIGIYAFGNCTLLTSATFENTENWIVATSSPVTSGLDISADIASASTAATCLHTTYASYYWHRHDYTVAASSGQGETTYTCTGCGGTYTANYELGYSLSGDETYYIVTGITIGTDTDVVIPSTYNGLPVQEIADYAFYGNSTLTSVVIGKNVTSIGRAAFYSCTALTSITIPDSVATIGDSAFYGCTALASITIGSGVTSIGNLAFYNTAYYNTTANWTDGVLYMGTYLISADTSLTDIVIPVSVAYIGEYAFNGCTALVNVYYEGTAEEWSAVTIGSGNDSLSSATVYYYAEADSTTAAGNYWYYDGDTVTMWSVAEVNE